jgi:eukaryotic-like serine/threonine-protein kinase
LVNVGVDRKMTFFGETRQASVSRFGHVDRSVGRHSEVDAILSASQRLRLRLLALQSEGLGAFREPEVVAGVGLSPREREKIRAIEEEVLIGQMREMRAGGMLGDAGNKPREPEGSQAMERALAVLTAEQSRRWSALVGEPIDGQLSAFPMPFSSQRDPKRRPR